MPAVSISAASEYISQTPSTLGSSGYVEYEVEAIYPGILDVFIGTDSADNLLFDTPEIWDDETSSWIELTGMIEFNNTYIYEGADTWYVISLGSIDESGIYKLRFYVVIPWSGLTSSSGDFIFGAKPPEESLRESFNKGNAYYVTTSWNIEWENVIEIIIDNPDSILSDPVITLSIDVDDIDWESVQEDGDDIRIVDCDNLTVLSYEFDSFNYGVSADILVAAPPLGDTDYYERLLLYYGNDTASAGTVSVLTGTATVQYRYVTITTNNPQNLSYELSGDNQVILSWDKGFGTDYTYVVRQLGSYPESITDGTVVYYGMDTSCADTGIDIGLSLNTTDYYYRAFSENIFGEISADYAEKEVPGMMIPLLITMAIVAFAFWKREVWLYLIACIACLFFAYQYMQVNLYISIAPYILALYLVFKAVTAWFPSKRG
jgi:hypothetical protein